MLHKNDLRVEGKFCVLGCSVKCLLFRVFIRPIDFSVFGRCLVLSSRGSTRDISEKRRTIKTSRISRCPAFTSSHNHSLHIERKIRSGQGFWICLTLLSAKLYFWVSICFWVSNHSSYSVWWYLILFWPVVNMCSCFFFSPSSCHCQNLMQCEEVTQVTQPFNAWFASQWVPFLAAKE